MMITTAHENIGSAVHTEPAPARLSDWRSRLMQVVILGGAVGQRDLIRGAKRSLLGLPVESRRSVMDLWYEQTTKLATALDRRNLPVRVMVNDKAPVPDWHGGNGRVTFAIEEDPLLYRGTGGLLHDLLADRDEDDLAVVVAGGQILLEDLPGLVEDLARLEADVAVAGHADGTPLSLMLIRCGALQTIKASGFVDLKEQALPMLSQHHRVAARVHHSPVAISVRTRRDYLRALGAYHGARSTDRDNPFAERWSTTFSIVEDGAEVHPSARIHDSVVLRGATVGRDAVVAQSVVCSGAKVRSRRIVGQELLAPGDSQAPRERR